MSQTYLYIAYKFDTKSGKYLTDKRSQYLTTSMQVNLRIDTLDKNLLNEIQWVFPLTERPFLEISKHYNVPEDEIIQRIMYMKGLGLIRQINAIFDTRRLGYKSALIAFAVKPDKLDYVANEVNKHPGVSHNYERNHEFNMWFTLAVPPYTYLNEDLNTLASLEGVIKYRLLPTLKLYKIGVRLDMVNEDLKKPQPTDKVKKLNPSKFDLTDRDKDFIRELQKDLEIIPEPFKALEKTLASQQLISFRKLKNMSRLELCEDLQQYCVIVTQASLQMAWWYGTCLKKRLMKLVISWHLFHR